MDRGDFTLIRCFRARIAFSVMAVVVAGGSASARASHCQVAERPEWAAFEFLDLQNGNQQPTPVTPLFGSEGSARISPLPCSGDSHGLASSVTALETGFSTSIARPDRDDAPSFSEVICPERLSSRYRTLRLDRPPRES
jgi:hypothetical protein